MQITVIGTGYVGLVTGVSFASHGHKVVCIEKVPDKVNKLKSGNVPFYEPNLENLLRNCIENQRIEFKVEHDQSSLDSDVFFIAVGTPQSDDGSVNMQYVKQAAEEIGAGCLRNTIVVNKSTMAIGSTSSVQGIIDQKLQERKLSLEVSVIANPEFLREGSAINDFLNPDRVIVGTSHKKSFEVMKELYEPFLNKDCDNLIQMDSKSAELTKYAANAMLASRISFMNEIALISEAVNADIESIKHGIGLDHRIGKKFLNPGIGYGGSCFPKDLNALIYSASELGIDLDLLTSVQNINEKQKILFIHKLEKFFKGQNKLKNKNIAIWGLSYKPNTDDIRDAPSINLFEGLLRRGSNIYAYDPIAVSNMEIIFPASDAIHYKASPEQCLHNADALIVCTEWDEFSNFRFNKNNLSSLKVVMDGRNCLDKTIFSKLDIEYQGVGR